MLLWNKLKSLSRKQILTWVGVLTLLMVAGIFFVRFLFYQGILQMNNPDVTVYPLRGIDISNHQGLINWEEMRQENLSFIIIKATEGADYRDSLFLLNYSNSKQEGYATGAYHFFRFRANPKEQAQNFIKIVPKDSFDLPPVVDFEFGANDTTGLVRENVIRDMQELIDILENHYQRKPILYVTRPFYKKFMIENFRDYPLWIRSIYKSPFFREKRTWAIWQYANRGHVKGIDTFVDLNVINGRSINVLDQPVNNEVSLPD